MISRGPIPVGGKAPHQIWPHLELVEHADVVVPDLGQNTALQMDQSDEVGDLAAYSTWRPPRSSR